MTKDIHVDISNALDEHLLDAISNGAPLLDEKGDPVLDAEGNAIRRPPSAAILNTARQRLKDLGITKIMVEGDATDEIRKWLGLVEGENPLETLKLPKLSEEPDAATG